MGASGDQADKQAGFLVDCMTELAQTVNKLAGTKRKREEDDGDVYDGKLPGQRALLSDDKRKKEVGFVHLAKERNLKHMKNLSKWPRSKPFSRQYNKELGELMEVESSQLECELQIKKLRAAEVTDTAELYKKEAKMEILEEQWLVYSDKLRLLDGCSDLAEKGDVALAWELLDMCEKKETSTSESAQFDKLKKKAAENL